jgi:pimeloyl-ACP methyl ester carboxylesterase
VVDAVVAGIERIVPEGTFRLMGFSFGSLIGGMVAARMGDRVSRFILVGPGALGPTQRMEEFQNWRLAKDPAELAAAQYHNLRVQMIKDPARIDDLAVYLQTLNTARARTRSRKLIRPNPSVQREILPGVRAPMHAIWGELDATSGALIHERGKLLGTIQPGAGYTLIPGAGHWVAFEAPEAFNAAALQLLQA